MGVTLPYQLPVAGGWSLVDFRELQATSDHAADGVAIATLPAVPPDELWIVDHAVVACSSTTDTEARWYNDAPDPRNLLDGTSRGNFDVADWPAGLRLQPSRTLVCVWAGASVGAVGTLTVQLRVMRHT